MKYLNIALLVSAAIFIYACSLYSDKHSTASTDSDTRTESLSEVVPAPVPATPPATAPPAEVPVSVPAPAGSTPLTSDAPKPAFMPEPPMALKTISTTTISHSTKSHLWDFGDGESKRRNYKKPDNIGYRDEVGYSASDDAYSVAPETDKDIAEKEESAIENTEAQAHILTAGELHDFSKWELWTDVSAHNLQAYQEDWLMRPMQRYAVQVVTEKGKPLVDARVELVLNNNKTVWAARTDNTGKAELWAKFYLEIETTEKKIESYTLRLPDHSQVQPITAKAFSQGGINHITVSAPCNIPNTVDALFVVDATGSMGDEINYLKAELNSIASTVKKRHPMLNLRLGSVFYKDTTDDYVTRKSDFSDNISKTTDFIKAQFAGGGGDFPEAVEEALRVSVEELQWSSKARTRLIFLVLDAPPHEAPQVHASLQRTINQAAQKGIRIIPITGSGIDKSTEYLMRSMALATNGTYVFLTDHSGIGGGHIQPTTDQYDVELLNDLIVRLFDQYVYTPDCNTPTALDPTVLQITDTMYIRRPRPIAQVILDSTLVHQQPIPVASNDPKPLPVDTSVHNPQNPLPSDPIPSTAELKYYPNPTKGLLTIEILGEVKEVFLADMSGKLLGRYQVKDGQRLQIDMGQFPSGMYLLKCLIEEKWLTGKVVVLR